MEVWKVVEEAHARYTVTGFMWSLRSMMSILSIHSLLFY